MSSKFVLQQEDGTVANGNARGQNAVDLQMSRSNADQVAGYNFDVITGGRNNKISANLDGYRFIGGGYGNTILASGYSVIAGGFSNLISSGGSAWNTISGGRSNTAYNSFTTIGGGYSNTVSSDHSVVSGGQSNTASTNSHATVVGGSTNTASGQYSVAGGSANIASGQNAIAIGGYNNRATNLDSVTIGGTGLRSTAVYSVVTGGEASEANGGWSTSLGGQRSFANSAFSVASGFYSKTYLNGQVSHGNGYGPYTAGYQQFSSLLPVKTDTLSSAAITVLSLNNTGTELIIPDGTNRAWNVTVKWVAVCTATGSGTTAVGDVAIATDSFMFKKVSGTSSIGTVQNLQNSQDATMAGATCSYAVGGSQDLQITFTAPASANATTFRVVAKVELTECAW